MAGYRALYSLSCEKGYHLWNSDLGADDSPLEANLGFTCRKNGKYLGSQAVMEPEEERRQEATASTAARQAIHKASSGRDGHQGVPRGRQLRGVENQGQTLPRRHVLEEKVARLIRRTSDCSTFITNFTITMMMMHVPTKRACIILACRARRAAAEKAANLHMQGRNVSSSLRYNHLPITRYRHRRERIAVLSLSRYDNFCDACVVWCRCKSQLDVKRLFHYRPPNCETSLKFRDGSRKTSQKKEKQQSGSATAVYIVTKRSHTTRRKRRRRCTIFGLLTGVSSSTSFYKPRNVLGWARSVCSTCAIPAATHTRTSTVMPKALGTRASGIAFSLPFRLFSPTGPKDSRNSSRDRAHSRAYRAGGGRPRGGDSIFLNV
ncbi:unnamed protein product [Trichogramma brassicae]|uniref:Uncharacterized protein n=1 Tax=Trichogramma brassicae TaxID=86971 RepID=A0A6H5HSK9_9HYME|nr:unnamed protein product [Trichogramma brassicae]